MHIYRNLKIARLANPGKYQSIKLKLFENQPVTHSILEWMEEEISFSKMAVRLAPLVNGDHRRARELLFDSVRTIRAQFQSIWRTARGGSVEHRSTAYSIRNFATPRQMVENFGEALGQDPQDSKRTLFRCLRALRALVPPRDQNQKRPRDD